MQIDITNTNWKQISLYGVIVILLFCLSAKCESEKVQMANVDALNAELAIYKLKNGQLVVTKEALVYTNKELREKVLNKDLMLKELAKKTAVIKTVTRYVNKIRVDTINVNYADSIQCLFERTGSLASKDYSLNYKSNQDGLQISDLAIDNNVTIVTGTTRKWFLGKETQTISITNSNKLVSIESLEHFEIKREKRWWDSNLFKIGLGFAAGALIVR
jgi:cell division protein FtsB